MPPSCNQTSGFCGMSRFSSAAHTKSISAPRLRSSLPADQLSAPANFVSVSRLSLFDRVDDRQHQGAILLALANRRMHAEAMILGPRGWPRTSCLRHCGPADDAIAVQQLAPLEPISLLSRHRLICQHRSEREIRCCFARPLRKFINAALPVTDMDAALRIIQKLGRLLEIF
jgi:hypothetical protein